MLWIFLNNGHGNDTAGKQWTFNGKTFYEWESNRETVKRVAKKLDALGIKYHIITPEDYDVSLEERARRVNALAMKYGKDKCLLLSVHSNASKNHDARGVSVWTSRGLTKSDKYAEVMWIVGKEMFPSARMLSDLSDGDHDFEAGFYMVTKTICPAVLVEAFFYDNRADFDYLMSEEGREAIANWYVASIVKCIELHDK
jgi:N-acetylmuramoyl-L-alanine amidase